MTNSFLDGLRQFGRRLVDDRRRRRQLCLHAVLAAAAAIVAVRYPMPFGVLLLAAGAALLITAGLNRARRGAETGAPPPAVRLPFRFGYFSDTDYLGRIARRLGPVFRIRPLLAPVTCIADLAVAHRLLIAHADRLRSSPLVYDRLIEAGFLRTMSGDDHRKYRALLSQPFRLSTIDHHGGAIRRQQRVAMENATHGVVDPRVLCDEILFRTWALLFYGLDAADSEYARLVAINRDLDRFRDGDLPLRGMQRALREYDPESRTTFIGAAASAMTGDDLRTAGYNFLFLFNNSRRDVCGLWVWVAYLLCRNPDWLGRLRRSGNPAESSTLARRIVLESLRLRQSEFLWRIVTGDIDFDGMFLPEGTTIRVCVREAHRNPVYFPDPERFDPDRFLAPAWPPRAFAPFGIGQHACIGQELTLGVTSRFVESMAEFHWRLAGDGPPIHPSARGHWQPSDRFRVVIAATDRQA